ncbi:unnamed protein product [Camellia sinensis]
MRTNSDARNMGKKGSWFAAIKRVFVTNSKDKVVNGSDKKSSTKEKKGKGILRDGETKSFIPLFREPSSIEKILGEADQQIYVTSAPTPAADQPETPPLVLDSAASPRATSPTAASPRATSSTAASLRATSFSPAAASARATSSPTAVSAQATSSPTDASAPATSSPTAVSAPATSSPTAVSAPATSSPTAASPQATSPSASSRAVHHRKEVTYRPEPTLKYQHLSAIRIQTAYRGYMARRSFTALRGLVRLQGAVRAQNVERQTINAMKMMQFLVRVQTQIQSRRTQMLENQAIQRRQACKNDKDLDSSSGKWTATQSEAGLQEEWDDSLLTKEEIEARMHRKMEAIIKRERVMAYAHAHQLLKGNPKSAPTWAMDIRSGGFPWWWNWLERHHLPPANPSNTQTTKSFLPTPPRPTLMSETKPSPQPATSNYKQDNITSGLDRLELLTPTSTRSAVPAKKYLKPRSSVAADSASDVPLRDDDSLMSCPPFSVPNYMTPTVSAKAKVRTNSNPNRFPGTLSGDSNSKRRFSFPLTPNIGSFKWNKGSTKDSTSQRVSEKDQSLQSVGDLSIDSTVSMPAAVGRKPFNRFV